VSKASSRKHQPRGQKWRFDGEVTRVFDDMLARSIPQYDVMRDAVTALAVRYADPRRGAIVDLGCSRGEALYRVMSRLAFARRYRYVGVEASIPMFRAARQRFAGVSRADNVDVLNLDLRTDYPAHPASVTMAILTLQFIPIEHRQRVVRRAYEAGGAFIVVEKVLGSTAELDETMVDEYLKLKARNGYGREEIERKKMSLEGVLVPVTARWNEEMLRAAGFNQIECFWRWMNFAGWVAVK